MAKKVTKKVVKKAAPKKKAFAKKKAVAKKKAAPKKKAAMKKAAPKKSWAAKAVGTKADLISSLKASVGADLSAKTTNELVDNLFNVLAMSIKKNSRFTVPGFGTFNVKKRKARTGRNPQTGAKIRIKASKTISFKPTPKVKEKL